jgi:sugar porter (SP) family MFS transporter
MFGIGLLPATLLTIGMFFLPESPRWLVMKNKIDIARATLKHLRQRNDVEHEIREIRDSLTLKNAKFSEIFKPWIRPVLFLGMMLGLIQQVTGINTIIYYAPSIFTLAGFQDTSSTILATVGIGIVNVLATFIAVRYLDTIGRRPLLLAGLTGMGISLLVLSFAFKLGTDSGLLMWAAMACTFTYIISFSFSLGAILWVIVSEIFPLEVRATAMGVAMFSCFLWNFVVSSTFLTLLDAMGPANTFFMYATLCVLSLIFCYYKVPETKGVTLEQIEDNIRQGMPLRELGLPSTAMALAAKAT